MEDALNPKSAFGASPDVFGASLQWQKGKQHNTRLLDNDQGKQLSFSGKAKDLRDIATGVLW